MRNDPDASDGIAQKKVAWWDVHVDVRLSLWFLFERTRPPDAKIPFRKPSAHGLHDSWFERDLLFSTQSFVIRTVVDEEILWSCKDRIRVDNIC